MKKTFTIEITLDRLEKIDKTIEKLERYQSGKQNSGDNLIDEIAIFQAIKDMSYQLHRIIKID